MSTLICKFLYNLPQTKEWVRWVVIGLIIGMVIYFIKQKKKDELYTYFHIKVHISTVSLVTYWPVKAKHFYTCHL